MGIISILWGIVALLWMLLAFIPLLGWGNWFMIPFAAVGAILAGIGLLFKSKRAKTGLILNIVAIVIGLFRLHMGGGIF